jgi:uncharacterized membrane protein YdbT with pleckstrin-like domain
MGSVEEVEGREKEEEEEEGKEEEEEEEEDGEVKETEETWEKETTCDYSIILFNTIATSSVLTFLSYFIGKHDIIRSNIPPSTASKHSLLVPIFNVFISLSTFFFSSSEYSFHQTSPKLTSELMIEDGASHLTAGVDLDYKHKK